MTTTEEIIQNVMQMDDRAKSYVAAIATAVLQTQQMMSEQEVLRTNLPYPLPSIVDLKGEPHESD